MLNLTEIIWYTEFGFSSLQGMRFYKVCPSVHTDPSDSIGRLNTGFMTCLANLFIIRIDSSLKRFPIVPRRSTNSPRTIVRLPGRVSLKSVDRGKYRIAMGDEK